MNNTSELDLSPPYFEGISLQNARQLTVQFGEKVRQVSGLSIVPKIDVAAHEIRDTHVILRLATSTAAGTEYLLSLTASDESGNSIQAVLPFWGYNEDLPAMLINELTVEGSKSHPDIVELVCLEAGNVGGVTVYDGAPGDWDERIVLPGVFVEAGDFLLIHWKPEGIATEINETRSRSESEGIDASDKAWDFWVEEGNGLPNTTGLVTLAESPHGSVIDAVLYSTKSYDAEREDRGFGRMSHLTRMKELVASGAWTIAGDFLVPEDSFNPEASTATRSICRSTTYRDSDSKEDWHIVPTSQASFGTRNSDERHE